jgi:hypothetical protein
MMREIASKRRCNTKLIALEFVSKLILKECLGNSQVYIDVHACLAYKPYTGTIYRYVSDYRGFQTTFLQHSK